MNEERGLSNMIEWPAYENAEANSTAQRSRVKKRTFVASGSGLFAGHVGLSSLAGLNLIGHWEDDDPIHGVSVNDPVRFDLSPTTILVNIKGAFLEDVYTLRDPVEGFTAIATTEARATFVPGEYELLMAITDAPVDLRQECMRVLGLAGAENDEGYVERGPDPQAVDSELMTLLDPRRLTS